MFYYKNYNNKMKYRYLKKLYKMIILNNNYYNKIYQYKHMNNKYNKHLEKYIIYNMKYINLIYIMN